MKKEKEARETEEQSWSPNVYTVFILLLTPSIIYILLGLTTHISLENNLRNCAEERLSEYYTSGWPVRKTDHQIEDGMTTESVLGTTDYQIDVEYEDAWEQYVDLKGNSTAFYIDGIAQPTQHLEHLFSLAEEGFQTENHDLISYSLQEITQETERLEDEQVDDIYSMIDHQVSAIKSMNLIAPYYGTDFTDDLQQAVQIRSENDVSLATYHKLESLKNSVSDKFDTTIQERGGTATEGKRILIIIGQQRLYMIEDYEIIKDLPASTGIKGHGTAAGEFEVYEKIPMAWGYYEIWMPNWLTIYYVLGRGNGIHGIPVSPVSGRWSHWDNVVGVSPITYGCVMPHDWDAKLVYEWADIGTPVSIVY